MRNFFWVLGPDLVRQLPRGISAQYLLPRNLVKSAIDNSVEFRIFLVERRGLNRLIAVLHIDSFVEVSEGENKGDYILFCDQLKSFRIFSNQDDAAAYQIKITAIPDSVDIGFYESSDFDLVQIIGDISNSSEVRFSAPDSPYFSRFNIQISAARSRTLESLAKEAIRQIVSNMSLSDIWSQSGQFYKRPISSFAFELIKSGLVLADEAKIKDILFANDPFNLFLASDFEVQRHNKNRRFDAIFEPIIPEEIEYKKYSPGNNSNLNALQIAQKTENANARHQDILKEICAFLIRSSVQPFESNSVDLMFSVKDMVKIVEVKSANAENFFSQASGGALQLAHYAQSLSNEFTDIEVLLVIEKISDQEHMSQVLSALSYLGVSTLVYDAEKPVPERYSRLLEFKKN